MAVARDPVNVPSSAPDMISKLPDAFVRINELLDNAGALEVLLLGRSGAGKSSFINAMFDKNLTDVGGGVSPETKEVTSYCMKVKETEIKVYDSPGFERGGFRKQRKCVRAIKEACKTIDYVFLFIRLDDQLQKSDEDGLKCLAKGFGSCPEFWKKTIVIFTRTNLVSRHLEGKEWQTEIRTLARKQMGIITNLLTRINSRIVLNEGQYLLAGSPFKGRRRRQESDDDSHRGLIDGSDTESANPMILRPEQYDNPQEWVPHLVGSWLLSDSEDIQKIKLLKTQLTKKEIASHTTLNGSSAVGLAVGIACCIVGAGASIAGPVGPAIGIPLITIGATTIAISATTGVSTNASFTVKIARKMRYTRAIAEKESQSDNVNDQATIHTNPAAEETVL